MSVSASVVEIARRHASLPVNRSYTALKQVLRDWLAYTYDTPLHKKPTHRAELHVHVYRHTHTQPTTTVATPPITTDAGHSGDAASAPPTLFDRWYGAMCGTVAGARDTNIEKAATAHDTEGESVSEYSYIKAVALDVWTALLPWETQMGLSGSDLTVEHSQRRLGTTVEATQSLHVCEATNDEPVVMDDPYGVVSAPSAFASLSPASAFSLAGNVSSNPPPCWPAAPAPAMLFLMSTHAVRAHRGLHFWSGGITSSLDVLFARTVLPSSISSSPSFAQLRRDDAVNRVRDNLADADVVAAYFPENDLHSAIASLRVQSCGHLDPYPRMTCSANASHAHPNHTNGNMCCHSISGLQDTVPLAASEMDKDLPHSAAGYVVETIRHVVRDAVQQALRESSYTFARRVATPSQTRRAVVMMDSEKDARIDLTLELSDALKAELEQKAQLAVRYVPLLEAAIEHHLKQRMECGVHESHHDERAAAGRYDGAGDRPISVVERDGDAERTRVWLSETEHVWMSRGELRERQAAAASSAGGGVHVDGMSDSDAYLHASAEQQRHGDPDEEDCVDQVRTSAGADNGDLHGSNDSVAVTTVVADLSAASLAREPPTGCAANSSTLFPSFVQPAQPHAVRAKRSIGLQSPMLASETEGRPHYLVPSFTQRHEAPVLQEHLCLSADKLARYSRARPDMPTEQPVDYELFDLCLRLGVGRDAVVAHYYQRMLRDWTRELVALRRSGVTKTTEEVSVDGGGASAETCGGIAREDVQRMLRLVQDSSLQVPEELCALVEAVAHRKGIV